MKLPSHFNIVGALSAIDLLSGCSDSELAALAPHADVLTLAAGDALARPRMVAREFIGILDGYVHETDESGALRVLARGEQIGAAQLFERAPHTTSFTAATTTTLVVVFGPSFRAVMWKVASVRARLADPAASGTECPQVASLKGGW
jgi:signal-transduction protein with cAMP-binding, CBS, and nucleotidyltransferase domain